MGVKMFAKCADPNCIETGAPGSQSLDDAGFSWDGLSVAEIKEPAISMNGSTISEFILLGFSCSGISWLFLSTVVLACCTTSFLGNFLIMVTVWCEPQLLSSPMYYFLANLSLIDISLGCVAAPKLAADLVNCGHSISFGGCIAQVFFLHLFGGTEMLLLTLMAYDRYVAIYHPLRYMAIMDRQRCLGLLLVCWAGGFVHATIQMVAVAQLPYCGPNILDNFFCDIPQVIKLACSGGYAVEILTVANSSLLTLPCFLTLLVSYAAILSTFCGRLGKDGRKALSTCSSHLMVVSLFYVPIVFVYLKPFSSSHMDKIVSMFYMVATPALNPLIYALRNQEIKDAVGKWKSKQKLFPFVANGVHV
ncbi:olfactory receptor 4Q3-like [Eublepharis macularius]|uniref:Olfactory receptor n=1 Tax=Eublepharis macularius TaxID=481883 RepID=A0AA97K7U9_EUBMA|nr:olfactory receptor 4Q3-like [Eublepharis macularius]